MGTRAPAKLVLGTAQLGMAYGAANRIGQPSAREAELILRSAAIGDDRLQKQARGYVVPDSFTHGSAEQRIGAALAGAKGVSIVTKLAPLDEFDDATPLGAIRQAVIDSVRRSCTRLGTDRLEVLLLHRAHHLTWRHGAVWNTVKELRDEGAIYDLGVSVYTPEEALTALDDPDMRYLQLPFNAIDWRWRASGAIEAIGRRPQVTVHARSALLQGLLAGDPGARWPHGIDRDELTVSLMRLTRDLDRDSPADLCLAYVRAQAWIDGVVVGMETVSQLALNLALFARPPLTEDEIGFVDTTLPRATERLLNPALWAKAA